MSEIMLHGILNMPLPDQPEDCDIVTWVQFKSAARDASTRIKELEAKLAKAVEIALEECPFQYGTGSYNDWWHDRRTALAELKGEK